MRGKKEYLPLVKVEDVLSVLNKISIFGGLSREQISHVIKLLKKVFYSADEYIFRKGEEPSHIYIVRSGEVKIVVDADEGPLEIIAFETGHCFGETAVIGIQPHPASAVAVKDTELIVLSREALLSIFDSDKELFGVLMLNIAREACRRLHQTDEILLHYVFRK